MEALKALVEKAEIENCLKRYARGVDRRDWDLVRDCFHPDAMDQHGEFSGNRDEFIEWVRLRHQDVPFSMHYLLNCLIDFSCETQAFAETYFWAIQRRETMDAAGKKIGNDHEVFGRYVDTFAKRDGTWRIASRKVAYDSTRQMPSSNHLRQLVGVLGRRDKLDPVYGDFKSAAE